MSVPPSALPQRSPGERPQSRDSRGSEALSLWVLNRPEAELVPSREVPAAESKPEPSSQLLIVLGSQGGEACAQAIAQAGLARLEQGQNAHDVAVQALMDAARFRWPHVSPGTRFHFALHNSEGRAAAVLWSPLVPAPEQSLAAAWRYGGIIDARWRATPAPEPDAGVLGLPAICSDSAAPPEPGTVAVLLASSGHFEASLIQLQADSDAGLLGYAAQPAAALAAGPKGAVAVIGGCGALPEAAGAGPVYAALAAGGRPDVDDNSTCGGHAWLTATTGEVAAAIPTAWALARARAPVPAPRGAEPRAEAATDAGAARGGAP